MIRRVFLALVLGAGLPLHAQPPARLNVTAKILDAFPESGEFSAKGNVRLLDQGALITCDEMSGNHKTGDATARGNVVLTRGAVRLLADELTYHRRDGTFAAQNVRLGSFPYYAEGESATGTPAEITVINPKVSYGEPGPWQPTLSATRGIFAPNQQVKFEGAFVGVGRGQLLPFPHMQQSLSTPLLTFVSPTGGYRSSLGVFAEADVQVPVALGVRLGADVGLYSNRGVMIGPSGSYASGDNGVSYRGHFRTGYINDHGDKKTDVLGRPVPEDRGFIEWQHNQQLAGNVSLAAQLNWWRDSEVVRDFRPRAFFPVQEPDTFVESVYAGKNYFVSAFARLQPNSFQRVQERLPEIRFDLLPTAIGGGFIERFNASYARLREDPLPFSPLNLTPGPRLRSDRLDAYYGLERPIIPADWLAITPIVGGRVTHYANTRGALRNGNYTRVLGEFGVDAALRASGTFAYKNERWKIDGLRHLFTPHVSYRYIPEADKGFAQIPQIDRESFSTYLPPLGLGDVRNIDDLHATNTLRLGFDNTLQTRDAAYGARDLLVLNVANDFRFKRRPGERDVSEVHAEVAAMPARWLQLDLYQSFAPQSFRVREFNAGITLRDGNAWSVRFSNNFLRRELEDYAVDGRVRINEAYELLTRLHYDARRRRFNEQAYGVAQNLGNTWLISYVVTLYSGPRRESNFGVRVQIDTVRF